MRGGAFRGYEEMPVESARHAVMRRALILGGAVMAGALAARLVKEGRIRRRRLQRGELRELSRIWTWVDDCRWHARFCTAPRKHAQLPVVLVHGFGISSSYFAPLAERLAVFFDVYAPDLPGHGRTETPARPLGVPDLAAALARWLDVMRIERAHILGHSMGCQTAVELAVRRPGLVDRLVLVGPTMDRDARSVSGALPRFLAGGVHEPARMSLLIAKDYARMGARLLPELRAMFAYTIESRLPRLGTPVLLVRGEHDRVASARWIEELAHATPGADALCVRGAAHAVHFTNPDEIVERIRPFLDEKKTLAQAGS
jgi:2-hydroxy-6-oxonona-2,4-dienedioate hydrolase